MRGTKYITPPAEVASLVSPRWNVWDFPKVMSYKKTYMDNQTENLVT